MNTHAPRSTFHYHFRPLWSAIVLAALIANAALVSLLQDRPASPALNHEPAAQVADQFLPADVPADWWTAAQENIREAEYQVTWQDQTYLPDLPAAYQAPNRAHNLRTYFTPEGIRVIPRSASAPLQGAGQGGGWDWGLTLTGYGYSGAIQPVPAAELVPGDSRMDYQRGALTEWYVNNERGLEQGFTLTAPPSTAGNLSSEIILDLALSGNLTPHLTEDGAAIEFTTPGGVRVLRYSDLVAYDASGRALTSAPLTSVSALLMWRATTHATFSLTMLVSM